MDDLSVNSVDLAPSADQDLPALTEIEKEAALATGKISMLSTMKAPDIIITDDQIKEALCAARDEKRRTTGQWNADLTTEEEEQLVIDMRLSLLKMMTVDDIDLTEEEEMQAILAARKRKRQREYSQQYAQRVLNPAKQFNRDSQQIKAFVLANAGQMLPKLARLGGLCIDEWSQNIFDLLCLFFGRNPQFENMGEDYSLHKGILLAGNVGSGKTTMLRMFQIAMRQSPMSFNCASAPDLSESFSKEGHDGLRRYGQGAWLIDDVGTEDANVQYYGRYTNPFAEVILRRYNDDQPAHRFHITTNMTADEMQDRYDGRAASRMQEMFNILAFPVDAPDRRTLRLDRKA